jgi:transposase-like protein
MTHHIAVEALTDAALSPTCPLCHTLEVTLTNAGVAEGAAWRCSRCGQNWNAKRLATASAYARSAA